MRLTQSDVETLIHMHLYIGKNPENVYSIEYLVSHFNLGKKKLLKGYLFLFKKHLNEYQLRLNMNSALLDLEMGAPAELVAAKYRYQDVSFFSRCFKKIHSFPPEELGHGRD